MPVYYANPMYMDSVALSGYYRADSALALDSGRMICYNTASDYQWYLALMAEGALGTSSITATMT